MNVEKNIAIVKSFIEEVINNQRIDLIEKFWAKNMKWHGGFLGEIDGLDAYQQFASGAVDGSFSNMHLTIKDVVAQDDKVVLFFTNSGKNIKDFLGYEATNKEATWNGMGIYRIEGDKIAEAWFSEDLMMMFTQLGFISLNI